MACISIWATQVCNIAKIKTGWCQFTESVIQTIIAEVISEHEMELDNDDGFGSDEGNEHTAYNSKEFYY